MSKPRIFSPEIEKKQAELMLGTYNSIPIAIRPEIDVFARICEILYHNGFRAFPDGMHNQSTGCHFNWDALVKYRTVVDFQLAWPYA